MTVALAGDFGKPRPALVVQSDKFAGIDSVTVLLLTSTLVDAPLLRIAVMPNALNGLQRPSQIMIDKAITVRRDRVGQVIGQLDDDIMLAMTRSLAVFFALA